MRTHDLNYVSDPCITLPLDCSFEIGNHVAAQLIELRHRHKRAGLVGPRQRFETKATLPESTETAAHGFFHGREVLRRCERPREFTLDA